MVLCVGEILSDLISERRGDEVVYRRYAGGAPYNVACAVQKCGGDAGFCGRVGEDPIGAFLVANARQKGFSFLSIPVDTERNTTLAFVELDEKGERSFAFYRKGTADYHLSVEEILPQVRRGGIVHLGSLMLSEPEGRAFADALIAEVKAAGGKLSFDVNFREDIFRDRAEAVAVFGRYAALADILKLSENEIGLFTRERDTERALRALAAGKELAVLTLGARGAAYCRGGEYGEVPTVAVAVQDTTGAGDAFWGALLSRIDAHGFDGIAQSVRFANVCGALTTTRKGATDAIPTLAEINAHL